jgi:8-hydroxy-5-deazaflavin:NADPH oxidoreductase
MKIGIIGSSEVGQALATAFLSEGYEVMLGTRNTAKEEVLKWEQDHPGGLVGTFKETATFGEALVLAVAGSVTQDVIRLAGPENFAGKIVMDTTNPIDPAGPNPPPHGVLKAFTTLEDSLMERTQRLLPDAKLVKVFNSVGNTSMYKPHYPGGTPTMFICGNDEEAKKTVTDILTTFGWETEDMGSVEGARAIEPLCLLWCIPGFLRNQWTHAFKLLKL